MKKTLFSMLALLTTFTISAGTASFATIGVEEMPESMKKSR
ncbi:hypothetical protein [Clostridium sp. LIBA-8841]|nr:hypothetical protein [Clostridium sp. LIBA-8841]MDZ5253889.1 hypothetical protein [Clostridium sp. LIBA-8841]